MQFHFDVRQQLKVDETGVARLQGNKIKGRRDTNFRFAGAQADPLRTLIDTMGTLSSRAQRLPTTITTMAKFA